MIRIVNGKIYDPANGKNGEVGELWYNDGRIAEGGGEYETLDAEGCVVMAGGVDIHSHLAGEPLELLRDAANPIIPTVGDIGKQYAGMGYTAVVNAAVPALAARRTILEEQAIDGIDAFNLTWIGENPAFKQLIDRVFLKIPYAFKYKDIVEHLILEQFLYQFIKIVFFEFVSAVTAFVSQISNGFHTFAEVLPPLLVFGAEVQQISRYPGQNVASE